MAGFVGGPPASADGTSLQMSATGVFSVKANAITPALMERRTATHILIGQGAGADVAPAAMSDDVSMTTAGVVSLQAALKEVTLPFAFAGTEALSTTNRYQGVASGSAGSAANSGLDTTEVNIQEPCPFDGTIVALGVSLAVAPGAGITATGTLRVDGADTTADAAVIDTYVARTNQESVESVAVTKGQKLSLRWITSSGTVLARPTGYVKLRRSD